MTASKTHIEDMHARLEEITRREQTLIRALDEALAEADRKLLDDVRTVAIEHENRRAIILTELQALATRIGAFPANDEPLNEIEYEQLDMSGLTAPAPDSLGASSAEEPKGGDWRKAAENMGKDPEFAGTESSGSSEPPEARPVARKRA